MVFFSWRLRANDNNCENGTIMTMKTTVTDNNETPLRIFEAGGSICSLYTDGISDYVHSLIQN